MQVVLDGRGAVRYRGTGIGTYTYRLAEGLAATIQPPDGLLICLPPDAPRFPKEQKAGGEQAQRAPVVFWRLSSESSEDQRAEIAELCTRARADVLHMPQNGRWLPPVHCAVVTTVHDLIPFLLPQTCSPAYLKDCLGQLPWIVRRSEKLIAVSRHTAAALQEILDVPADRIAVIHEAPEPGYLTPPLPEETARVAAGHRLPQRYMLHVGGFSPRKNLPVLVRAIALLQGGQVLTGLPPDLVLTGLPGRDSGHVAAVARALGVHARLSFPGMVPVEDMAGLYAGASLVCCPSLEEGFSLPLVEAMATGVPLVVSDIPAHHEVAGEAALYFDPHDPGHLAEQLASVLTDRDLRMFLVDCGCKRVRRYSWRKAAVETWLVYRWAVSERVPGR